MDDFGNLQKTIDGGYISSSASFSNDGDVSGHHGSSLYSDVWVIKLDSAFNIEWQKSYEGTLSDWPAGIRQNAEGNFYVFAQSSSIDGDVPVNYGEGDYWILKSIRSVIFYGLRFMVVRATTLRAIFKSHQMVVVYWLEIADPTMVMLAVCMD